MKRLRWLRVVGVIMIIFGFFVVTMAWPTDLLGRPLTTNEQPLHPADVIIVLGAGTRKGADPLPTQAKLRTDLGVQLWKDGFSDRVLISGGRSKATGLVESDLMGDYAVAHGLDPNRLVRERASTSTRENAEFSLKAMATQKMTTAILVTSSYHTWRACRVFRFLKATIQCTAATVHPVPEKLYDRFVNFRAVVREYGAIVLYALRGYL